MYARREPEYVETAYPSRTVGSCTLILLTNACCLPVFLQRRPRSRADQFRMAPKGLMKKSLLLAYYENRQVRRADRAGSAKQNPGALRPTLRLRDGRSNLLDSLRVRSVH